MAVATPSDRRGIPAAAFVEDVQVFLTQTGADVATAIATLQERLQQYKLAEMKLLAQKRDLQKKEEEEEAQIEKQPHVKQKAKGWSAMRHSLKDQHVFRKLQDFSNGKDPRALFQEAVAYCPAV